MKCYRAELHVHTVLSPCAEVEMIPPLIVREALEKGIDLIAITDHNASANIAAVQKAAAGSGLVVKPGMELQTREEVHALCLFDTLEQIEEWQKRVSSTLPAVENNPDYFGEQFVVDESGDYLHSERQLLITSSTLSLNEAWAGVTQMGGLFIPAHVNANVYGLIAVLGLVPTDIEIEALEISRHISPQEALRKFPQIAGYPLIQSGDVHRLEEFLGANEFCLAAPTIAEMRKALRSQEGRTLRIIS